MLVSDITRKVQRLFGDTSNEIVINQQDIYDWLNEGQLRIVRDTHNLTASLSVAASTYPRALPADWVITKRVTYGVTVLRLIDIEDLDAVNVNPATPVDTPSFYYIFAGQIRLYPNLGATDTTTVIHDYVKLPTILTAPGNTPDVPVSYHEDLVRYCLMRAHERNENHNAMQESSAIFESSLGLRSEEASRQDDTFYVIRDDPNDTPDVYYIW